MMKLTILALTMVMLMQMLTTEPQIFM